MDPISMILLAVRGLSVVVDNPALGGGSSLKFQEVSKFLGVLGELIERGDEAHDELKAFADMVGSMADEGRTPTKAEWAVLQDRSKAAHAVIQEAAAALPDPEPDPEPEVADDPEPESEEE